MTTNWPFPDPPNVAVITHRKIMSGAAWIQYVCHDEEDGAWQFHPLEGTPESDAMVVGLGTVVGRDASLTQLADLPLGWCAWRESPQAAWRRAPKGQ